MRSRSLQAIGIIVFLALVGSPITDVSAAAADPPNIVLIIADDLGWNDCGPYGNPRVKTPNLDRLAREGMRFDRAFVTASSCSPSRASLITGRYPHSTGAEELHLPLPASQVTFVETLKKAGYWTASAGKWHLGNAIKDRFDLVREANPAGFQLGSKIRLNAEGTSAAQAGCDQWVPVLRDRPPGKPFFLWLASLDPHRDYEPKTIAEPHRPEDVVVPPFLPDLPDVRKDLALYYDEISRLDHHVGAVLDEIDRQKIAESTLVLFLSDNGRPFPRCKTTLYDSGIKTPMLARWPGHVPAGSVSKSLVSTVDLAPTFLRLAGLEPGPTIQGHDISAILHDPKTKVREFIFAERNWHDYASHGRAVRSENFLYIRNDDTENPLTPPADAVRSPTFEAMRRLRDEGKLSRSERVSFEKPRPKEELYDLATDFLEENNVVADPKYQAELTRLRKALKDWTRETGDSLPESLTPDEFDRETGSPLPHRQRPRTRRPAPAVPPTPKSE